MASVSRRYGLAERVETPAARIPARAESARGCVGGHADRPRRHERLATSPVACCWPTSEPAGLGPASVAETGSRQSARRGASQCDARVQRRRTIVHATNDGANPARDRRCPAGHPWLPYCTPGMRRTTWTSNPPTMKYSYTTEMLSSCAIDLGPTPTQPGRYEGIPWWAARAQAFAPDRGCVRSPRVELRLDGRLELRGLCPYGRRRKSRLGRCRAPVRPRVP
jgi:hypothetical protein